MVGSSFTNSHQDWRGGTYELFNDWARKQFGAKEMDSDEEAEVPVHLQKAKDIRFKVNKGGHFILPPRSDYKMIKEKQRVIRGYIGAVYRKWIHFSLFLFF
jgi:hypothetical protein